jgi:phage terminase small subunit
MAQQGKRGTNATEESKAARVAALRASAPNTSGYAGVAEANPDRPLTSRMKEFVKLWAQGETILSAALRAGYNDGGTYAYRLAKDPAILKIYHREKEAYAAAVGMTRQKVMEGLLEAVEMAKIQADPTAMIAGWREVGKMCGYYEPVKKQIDVNITGNVVMQRLNKLSDAELLKLIETETANALEGEFVEVLGDDEDE